MKNGRVKVIARTFIFGSGTGPGPPPSKENTKDFDHLVSKMQRVLTSGKENTKDFDIGGQPVGLEPDEKVYVDVFVATYLEV